MKQLLAGLDPIDLLTVASVAVLAIGTAMIFIPAAFVVVGALGLWYAVAASKTEIP